MDNEDKNDIIKKVETAGSNDGSDDNGGNNEELNADNNQEQPTDNQQDNNEQPDLNEGNFLLQNPKKLSIFAPKGSKEHMEINDLKENKECPAGMVKFKKDDGTFGCMQTNFCEPPSLKETIKNRLKENFTMENNTEVKPEVKPTEIKPLTTPTKEPLRRDKPFLPKRKSQPNPKANKDTLMGENN